MYIHTHTTKSTYKHINIHIKQKINTKRITKNHSFESFGNSSADVIIRINLHLLCHIFLIENVKDFSFILFPIRKSVRWNMNPNKAGFFKGCFF